MADDRNGGRIGKAEGPNEMSHRGVPAHVGVAGLDLGVLAVVEHELATDCEGEAGGGDSGTR